ncbi:MAG: hypothetical protein GY813_09240 [Halieaceae bacterium]|nr:hypothetical protein [Halieaceae bacterium]
MEEYFDGDQAAENADYEINSREDYIREANAGMDDPQAGEEEYGREHERAVCRSQGMSDAEIDAMFAEIDAAPKRSWEDIPY